MKVFLITPDGEQGPLTPAQINRMFVERKIHGDQLCRLDGSVETQPLKRHFRHMAPDEAVAHQARENIKTNVQEEKNRAAIFGGIAAIVGGVYTLFTGRLIRGIVLLVGGIILFSREYLKKGAVTKNHNLSGSAQASKPSETTYDY